MARGGLSRLTASGIAGWLLAIAHVAAHAQGTAAATVDLDPLPAREPITPAIDCAALASQDFAGVKDGPARFNWPQSKRRARSEPSSAW